MSSRAVFFVLALLSLPLLGFATPAAAHHRPNEATYVGGASDPLATGVAMSTLCLPARSVATPAAGGACFVTAPALLQVRISVFDTVNENRMGFRYMGVKNDGTACGVAGAGIDSEIVSTLSRVCTHFHVFPDYGATAGTIKIA